MIDPEDPREKFRRLVDSEADTQGQAPVEGTAEASNTPVIHRPTANRNSAPLPHRVDEVDMEATRVASSAFEYSPGPRVRRKASSRLISASPRQPINRSKVFGCLLQGLIGSVFIIIALGLIVAAVGIYEYYSIASGLPSVSDLQQRASQFETTRILDRNGDILYEILDPQAGRRTYIPLNEISPYLVAATISTEDKDFYTHGGFDPLAIVRAFWQNITSGETISGASTITQQLARALLLSPEERGQQSYMRKVREAILATEVERRYNKDEILELYLNEI
jgi:hypothetical protein